MVEGRDGGGERCLPGGGGVNGSNGITVWLKRLEPGWGTSHPASSSPGVPIMEKRNCFDGSINPRTCVFDNRKR